jgi:hypothetical protein
MGQSEENHEVYNNLTESIDTRKSNEKAVKSYLIKNILIKFLILF